MVQLYHSDLRQRSCSSRAAIGVQVLGDGVDEREPEVSIPGQYSNGAFDFSHIPYLCLYVCIGG